MGAMLPWGLTRSSFAPWKAQIGTEASPQPTAAHAGRPSPAIGTAAANCGLPYFAEVFPHGMATTAEAGQGHPDGSTS